jgi:PAS domain S-box-containing protein
VAAKPTTVIQDIDDIPNGLITTDVEFHVTTWDQAAQRVYGWSAEEVVGRHVDDVFRPEMDEAARLAFRRKTFEQGRAQRTFSSRRKDGTPVDIELVNVAIRDEHGVLSGYLGIHRDVSKRAPPRPGAVRVLLVEDHVAAREALASAFARDPRCDVVGEAGSLAEARPLLDRADVAIVDLGLPDGSGGELIADLRLVNPRAEALVLSASVDRAEIVRAVEYGAAGILHKTARLEEVIDTVLRLRAGEPLLSVDETVELLREGARRREREHEDRAAIAQLTRRELEVLAALAQGLGTQAIAELLSISVATQRNHMTNILAKLGVHSKLQALVFAASYGVVEIPKGPRMTPSSVTR